MKLQYLNGAESGKDREILPPGVGLGRETDNDIQLLVGGVSRYHARMDFRDGVWTLRDLGSTNGTKLNGVLLTQPSPLKNGDVVTIGDQMFRCDDDEQTSEKAGAKTVKTTPPTEPPPFVFRPPDASTALVQQPPSQEIQTPGDIPKTAALFVGDNEKPQQAQAASSSPFGNLFDSKATTANPAKQPGKLLNSNVLFYFLVVMIAIFCVVLFWKFQQQGNLNANANAGKSDGSGVIANPFFLYYEKFTVTKQHSIFKLKVLIENKHLIFSLDDLQSGRVFSPVIPDEIPEPAIEKLKNAICDTSFLSAVQQENFEDTADNNQSYSRIIVGFDDKFNDITIGETMLTSFSKVEDAVRSFLAEEFNLDPSMVESRDTLIREARQTFDLAENQFNSYKMNPSNLWRAIENYRIAVTRYEVFADKPPEWKIARERYASAQAIQDEIKKSGNSNVNLLYQRREFDRAVAECAHLMDFFPPDSDTYKNIKALKIKIEHIMNGDKK